jgi:UDP-glucuronate decarboxylase
MTWNQDMDVKQILDNLSGISFADAHVLVTGGAGFLGSWLSDTLLEQRAWVTCVDNLSSGTKSNVANCFRSDRFRFIEQDVSEKLKISGEIDFVFHLASGASPFEFYEYPIEIIKANTLGTMNALNIAQEKGAIFLFTSTSEIYGKPDIIPTPETYNGNVSPTGIRGCYDESKRAGEALCMAYLRQLDVDTRMVRIFNTYGPRMRTDGVYGRVIPRFIDQALHNKPITVFGDGTQTRSFCYVTDQVEGLLRLAYTEKGKGEVVNIGNNEELSILELADLIIRITGSKSEITFESLPEDDPPRRKPDISKAWGLLKWGPKVTLHEGLSRLHDSG